MVGAVEVGDGLECLLRLPCHVCVGRAMPCRVGPHQAEGGHVEIVARVLTEGCQGLDETADEGAVDARGIEDAERLGDLARSPPPGRRACRTR